MEASSHHCAKLATPTPPLRYNRATILAHNSATFLGYNCLPRKLNVKQLRYYGAIHASKGGDNSSIDTTRWLLEPIGDGDTKHIGFKTAMPDAFEIASSVVTVGRVPEKANVVIPVPTVSATHARIRSTGESLLITDLDSTNGTFIDERRLTPGVPSVASTGNKITFGDTHLAIFRVSKLENVETAIVSEESEATTEEYEAKSEV